MINKISNKPTSINTQGSPSWATTSAISHKDILKQIDELFPSYITNSSTSSVNTTSLVSEISELKDQISDINEMLLILQRDKNMEFKYPELAEAYKNYNRLLKMLIAEEILKDER